MAMEFFVDQNGEVSGPFSAQELKRMARDGEVSAHALIRKGIDGKPVKAADVKGLFEEPRTEATAVPNKEKHPDPNRNVDTSSMDSVTRPPSEAVATPPPLPAREIKATRANRIPLIVSLVGLALVLFVGVGFIFLPKNHAQKTSDDKTVEQDIVAASEQAGSDASRKSLEPRIDKAKQDELDWIAFSLDPPWKRYDIIEYQDINAEEHRFVMTGKIDEAKLKRYAEEYAIKYGSKLQAIELRFYAKKNRSKYRGEKTDHLREVDGIIEHLKILDEISNDLLACCQLEKDGEPLFVLAPLQVPKQSLLVLRHVLRQRTLDAEKRTLDAEKKREKNTTKRAEFDRKSKEREEQEEESQAKVRADLVSNLEELEKQLQMWSAKHKKPMAEINRTESLLSKARKNNNMTAVRTLESKLEKLNEESDLETLESLKIEIREIQNQIALHDRLTEAHRKRRMNAPPN